MSHWRCLGASILVGPFAIRQYIARYIKMIYGVIWCVYIPFSLHIQNVWTLNHRSWSLINSISGPRNDGFPNSEEYMYYGQISQLSTIFYQLIHIYANSSLKSPGPYSPPNTNLKIWIIYANRFNIHWATKNHSADDALKLAPPPGANIFPSFRRTFSDAAGPERHAQSGAARPGRGGTTEAGPVAVIVVDQLKLQRKSENWWIFRGFDTWTGCKTDIKMWDTTEWDLVG